MALLLIDATQGVTEQDSKIAGYIDEQGKAAIIVVNKWDAIEKDTGTMDEFSKKVRENLKFMDYAPDTVPVRADRPAAPDSVMEMVRSVYAQATRRVTTGLLNDILTDAQAALQPPATSGRRLKIYYATQQGDQAARRSCSSSTTRSSCTSPTSATCRTTSARASASRARRCALSCVKGKPTISNWRCQS